MRSYLDLSPTSLQGYPSLEKAAAVLNAALNAVDPYQAVARVVRREGETVYAGGRVYALTDYKRIWIIGAGKASILMAQSLVDIIGEERIRGGTVVTKALPSTDDLIAANFQVFQGDHPVPGPNSISGTQNVLRTLSNRTADDLVFCVISGGGSALFTDPVDGVTLDDFQSLTKSLLACGATIHEINTLRKHLDRVKGGGLLQLSGSAQIVSLILSDVVGSDLGTIASGPTTPDPTTFLDALEVIQRYRIQDRIPPGIAQVLQAGVKGELSETLKPEDPLLNRVQNILVASNEIAAHAALQKAEEVGFNSLLLTTYLEGEARQIGSVLASIARQCAATGEPAKRPACIIAGGETTVTLRGNGRGGRNQELALGAVKGMDGLENTVLITLATDGEDGSTDAAGAVVTGETASRADRSGMSPEAYLNNNDSYSFFDRMGDLLKPGPTGTNVNDLTFIFTFQDGENDFKRE